MIDLKYKENLESPVFSLMYDNFMPSSFYFRMSGEIGNTKFFGNINSQKCIKAIRKKYPQHIHIRDTNVKSYIYFKNEQILPYSDGGSMYLTYNIENELLKDLVKIIKRYKKKTKGNNIEFILPSDKGFEVKSSELKELDKNTLEDNYEIPQDIHSSISAQIIEKKSGLYIFYGPPGTGKTTYIRLLKKVAKDKKFIFLPLDLAEKIADPSLVRLLMDIENSVLIIEDAENLLVSRDSYNNSVISGILNLTSGLMGECLNMQIICTLNTDLKDVDSALLRKGRLIQSHEFKPLSIDKSQALMDKLGFEYNVESPMTLADIYNFNKEVKIITKNKPTIGFVKSK